MIDILDSGIFTCDYLRVSTKQHGVVLYGKMKADIREKTEN
jgi:hypothetical protein